MFPLAWSLWEFHSSPVGEISGANKSTVHVCSCRSMYHVAAVHAVNGVHKNLKKNIAYMCNCRSSEIWRNKYLWYTLMCIFINLWGAFKVYYHCSTVISFYGGRGISFYRALLYQDRWFDGMKEHWVRDPGLPNLRMVSWNLKTLSFGGDWTPHSFSDNITGCMGKLKWIFNKRKPLTCFEVNWWLYSPSSSSYVRAWKQSIGWRCFCSEVLG